MQPRLQYFWSIWLERHSFLTVIIRTIKSCSDISLAHILPLLCTIIWKFTLSICLCIWVMSKIQMFWKDCAILKKILISNPSSNNFINFTYQVNNVCFLYASVGCFISLHILYIHSRTILNRKRYYPDLKNAQANKI